MEITQKQIDQRRKKWLKLAKRRSAIRFNQKKFIKRFATYKKNSDLFPTNSDHEFNYYAAVSKTFDWKEKTQEEIEDMKKEVQWKAFEEIEAVETIEKPEMKRSFWRNKKPEKDKMNFNEMWIFSDGSGKTIAVTEAVDDSDGSTDQDRTLWKTSKMSLPVTLNEKSYRYKLQNTNLLWRSLEHIQQLYEENCGQEITEIFDFEPRNPANDESPKLKGDSFFEKNPENGPSARKARLSRWNFLRYDSGGRQSRDDELPKPSKSLKTKSYSMFFVRKKNYPRSEGEKNVSDRCLNEFDDYSSKESCNCSCCSCDTCLNDSTETSENSTKESSKENMAPSSEDDFQSQRSWGTEFFEKEPLRPPVYNPEDYATYLKKWGRKTNSGMQLPLYLSQSTGSINKLSADLSFNEKSQSSGSAKSSSLKSSDEKQSKKEKDFTLKMEKKDLKNKENIHRGLKTDLNVDFRNPILALSPQKGEMSLRQFSSVTELLGKLKVDLKLSFPSFVQEFVGDPVDGVTLLLELLRAVQLSQASQQQRRPPQIFRRALLDEHSCLVCLKHCLRCSDATRRLVSSTAGLFTLAVCIMSNVTQSRIIALELLTKACEIPENGHKAVSEALSTLRLRFGEPVRFRFLVGMLNSAGTIELLAAAMKFINVFVETSPNIQQKVYIQAELEQAGFDAKTLRKTLPCNSESVKMELSKWEKHYFDVEILQNKVVEVNTLHEKINLLEKRIEILQEEKGILQSLEQCLKERCSELEEEMSIKTTTTTATPKTPMKQFHNYNSHQGKRNVEKGESTPAEDEGISSSEQELSQDEDYIKGELPYNNSNDFGQKGNSNESRRGLHCVIDSGKPSNSCTAKNFKNMRSGKMKETNVDDGSEIIRTEGESNEEEETTIDEVIEELENIVNDAETAVYANEKTGHLNENIKSGISVKIKSEINPEERNRSYSKSAEREIFEETEIVPSLLHPQPPRKAKSLVHIYFPRRDFDSHDHVKSEFFDDDTDTESSDSLLTATREKKVMNKFCHKSLDVGDSLGSFSSTNTRTLFIKQENDYNDSDLNINLGFEERNIDEEEVKRKHLKNSLSFKAEKLRTENFSPIFLKDTKFVENAKKTFQRDFVGERLMKESAEKLSEKGVNVVYEKTTSFQGVKSCQNVKLFGEEHFSRRTQKYPPVPVKRSQTFHITTPDADVLYKRNEIKPKPKMGVRGLDFQRSTEKIKSDQGKYQSIEYKKNLERKSDINDRYTKRAFKDVQKNQTQENNISGNGNPLYRRGSFDGVFTLMETKVNREKQIDVPENLLSRPTNELVGGSDRTCAKIKSKSLEKMDEGLDSLVDIVIATDETKKFKPKTESNVEVTKNIGPRTRRSLAESSLFSPPCERTSVNTEEPQKPPKPAQRTSLARHNSSSTPLNLPREIKLAPVQPNPRQQIVYNFGVKSAKSEDSLYSAIKRYSPDGSSSPNECKANNRSSQNSSDSKTAIYSTPIKQSKLKNFFENNGDANSNQNFFKNDYSQASVTIEKPVTSTPRTVQNMTGNVNQKVKNFTSNSNQPAISNDYKSVPPKTNSSKPNFLLGTYQSQAAKNIPKPTSSVIHSINTFNNSFLVKKSNAYTGTKLNGSGCNGSSQNGRNLDNSSNRKSNSGNVSISEKLTDSPSGLY